MDNFFSSNSGFFPFSSALAQFGITDRIWGNAGDLVLPDVGSDFGGYMAAPAKAQKIRDRQALERLLRFVVPNVAENSAVHLLEKFGTLSRVFSAFENVRDGDTVGKFLSATRYCLVQALRAEIEESPVLSTSQAVVDYLSFSMAGLNVEEIWVLFLNSENRLIRDEIVSRGTINEAPIYNREIIWRALEYGSTALILAHNHPSGDPQPSATDIAATKRLSFACNEVNVTLHDHIIVARGGWVSLKSEGVI